MMSSLLYTQALGFERRRRRTRGYGFSFSSSPLPSYFLPSALVVLEAHSLFQPLFISSEPLLYHLTTFTPSVILITFNFLSLDFRPESASPLLHRTALIISSSPSFFPLPSSLPLSSSSTHSLSRNRAPPSPSSSPSSPLHCSSAKPETATSIVIIFVFSFTDPPSPSSSIHRSSSSSLLPLSSPSSSSPTLSLPFVVIFIGHHLCFHSFDSLIITLTLSRPDLDDQGRRNPASMNQ